MTRHDWIVLSGVVVLIVLAAAGVVFQSGRLDRHLGDVEQRLIRIEGQLDSNQHVVSDVQQRLSRIEGQLDSGQHVHSRAPLPME